jgi:hypothetical protein
MSHERLAAVNNPESSGDAANISENVLKTVGLERNDPRP